MTWGGKGRQTGPQIHVRSLLLNFCQVTLEIIIYVDSIAVFQAIMIILGSVC